MKTADSLFDFIEKAPTAFHTVAAVKERLLSEGYTELGEGDAGAVGAGKYFVTRSDSSIIAFRSAEDARGFMICASHSDSPSFRVKLSREKNNAYSRLDVEKYGGMIYYSWLDRPLSVAGRVLVRTESGVKCELVNLGSDLAVIPSLAIHLNRGVNDGAKFNPAVDMLPVYATGEASGIRELVSKAVGCSPDSIISHDLFLYVRERGRLLGEGGELMLCPRLDDLECVFSSLEGFLTATDSGSVPVLAVFDNEEVGSATKQGAASTFLADTLRLIAGSDQRYTAMLKNSFMVSADNAHAVHPNHPEMSDAKNSPVIGGGVVVKFNASQRYATDGVSHAIFSMICERAGVRTQTYYNRADLPGGSTLGSISNTCVSIPTVDIGLPQLAMHSAMETAGASDLDGMVKALREFYSVSLNRRGGAIDIL